MAPSDASWLKRDPAETPVPDGSGTSGRNARIAGSLPDIRTRTATGRPAPALHSIPANVAVLDGQGQIVAANEA